MYINVFCLQLSEPFLTESYSISCTISPSLSGSQSAAEDGRGRRRETPPHLSFAFSSLAAGKLWSSVCLFGRQFTAIAVVWDTSKAIHNEDFRDARSSARDGVSLSIGGSTLYFSARLLYTELRLTGVGWAWSSEKTCGTFDTLIVHLRIIASFDRLGYVWPWLHGWTATRSLSSLIRRTEL